MKKKKLAPLAPDSFLQGHLLRADPAPLSFETRGGGGGMGGVAYKDPARLPPRAQNTLFQHECTVDKPPQVYL